MGTDGNGQERMGTDGNSAAVDGLEGQRRIVTFSVITSVLHYQLQ